VQGDAGINIQGRVAHVDDHARAENGVFVYDGNRGYYDAQSSLGADLSRNSGSIAIDTSRAVPTAPEIRPVNTAVRYLMRALR
jgi:hypothetical protein